MIFNRSFFSLSALNPNCNIIPPLPDLLYHDDDILICNKPTGLLSVPGKGLEKQDCLLYRVYEQCPDALVVHRLDMSTSGLIIFARNPVTQSSLSRMFRERHIYKRYIAIVAGQIFVESGEITFPLNRDWLNRPKQCIDFINGKHSLTKFKVISFDAHNNHTRVNLEPVTGRTHQLRIHLAAFGHPILGDALYGNPHSSVRLLLHAEALRFHHPRSGAHLEFISPSPF